MDTYTIVTFIILGTLGGVAHVVLDAESWEDLKKFSAFKRLVIGAVIGYLYIYLHSDYGFPNTIMTFVSGYAGTDFIKGIIDRLTKKPSE